MRFAVLFVCVLLAALPAAAGVVDCDALTATQRRQAETIGACGAGAPKALCLPATDDGLAALVDMLAAEANYQATVPCAAARAVDDLGVLIAADAHPDLRGRTVMPGGRCGDRRGMNLERDLCREWETTGRASKSPRLTGTNVELHMVADAARSGKLPLLTAGPLPSLRWPLAVRKSEHGHKAVFADLTRADGPLWAVSVDYRKAPLPDGQRGGAIEWVGWDEFAERYKGSRPEGWNYPGGPIPRQLPRRDLGRFLGEITLSTAGGAPPPRGPTDPDEPEEPMPPEPPKPPSPAGPVVLGPKGSHVRVEQPDGGAAILNVLPGDGRSGTWELIRMEPRRR